MGNLKCETCNDRRRLKMFAFTLLICTILVSSVLAKKEIFPRSWKEFREGKDQGDFTVLFTRFVESFQKTYDSSTSKAHAFTVFSSKAAEIFDFNEQGVKRTYVKGITRFADMDKSARAEFVMPTTPVDKKKVKKFPDNKLGFYEKYKLLDGFGDKNVCDLRPYTTSIKDQSSCGSCWAFGTMAAAEASHFLWAIAPSEGNVTEELAVNKDAWQVSEQVLLDCCDTSNGCGGGGTSDPMECATQMGALPSALSHPYSATDGHSCLPQKSEASVYVSEWYEPCEYGDEECVQGLIGGPSCSQFFTAAFKTSIEVIDSFYDYVDGVYSDADCPDDTHNHSVAIVGWGTDETGQDYWIIRNSWGEDWGLDGYFYMARGQNMCCVACANLFFQ